MANGNRAKLLGVLYAGPQHTVEGAVEIVEVPTIATPITISRVPNNLGCVIKAQRLLEFEAVLAERAKDGTESAIGTESAMRADSA